MGIIDRYWFINFSRYFSIRYESSPVFINSLTTFFDKILPLKFFLQKFSSILFPLKISIEILHSTFLICACPYVQFEIYCSQNCTTACLTVRQVVWMYDSLSDWMTACLTTTICLSARQLLWLYDDLSDCTTICLTVRQLVWLYKSSCDCTTAFLCDHLIRQSDVLPTTLTNLST